MKRQITIVAMSTAFGIMATGCASGGPSATTARNSAYCTSFALSKSAFQDMESGDIGSLEDAFALFHDLAAQSPEAISSEWRTLDGAFVTFEKSLGKAGLDIEQLDAVVSQGKIPKGVDVVELQQLMGELEQLGSVEFAKAADTIETYGRDECAVDLSS